MRRATLLVAALMLLTTVATGCQAVASTDENRYQHIVVYAFSTEEKAFTEGIFPAFRAYWQERAGQDVTYQSLFSASEDLTEAILNGERADVAILSNEQHAVWLHINDLVESDWHAFPHAGIITRSPLVIVVREGNPLGIKEWTDLARPGLKLVHADPRTSGGAQWALLAEYGSAMLDQGGSTQAAEEQLRSIWANVISSPDSSREALKEFMFGTGDAMITYEQDALLAQARGAALEVVIPRRTVMSEHVAVIVDENVQPSERDVVEAFVAFLWSQSGQKAFTRYYFRAVTDEALNEAVPEFHEVQRPFTVQALGGWDRAYAEIIYGIWEEQILKQAERVLQAEG